MLNEDHFSKKSSDLPAKLQPPEALVGKMPPLDHLIQASTSAWGDNIPLTEILKGLQENSETV